MKRSLLILLALLLASCGVDDLEDDGRSSVEAVARCDGDFCETHTFHFTAGGGFQRVAVREYCGRSGYPDSVLEVIGIAADDVIALPFGGDVILFGAPGDTALVRSYRTMGEDCAIGARSIRFEDGTRWNNDRRGTGTPVPFDLRRVIEGGTGNDRLRGSRRIDALVGHAGNDRLYGFGEDDVLDGGDGHDRLYGYQGDDLLFGGAGDDLLVGDEGNDTYVIDNGGTGGTETIEDKSGDLRVIFRGVYLHNNDESIFVRDGEDLVLSFSRIADRVVVRDYFRGGARLTSVMFSNVTSEGADLAAQLAAATDRTPLLRYRDATSGLVQASPSGYFSLGCATGTTPKSLGALPLVVLNTGGGQIRYREVSNTCGATAGLVGTAIEGRAPPACPPPGEERSCRVVVDATIDGQRTQPVTVEVYSSPW